MARGVNWKILIICFIAVFLTASVGSYFTQNTKSSWYQTIKPNITPPNFVFPIVWTILFILIAISLYFVLEKNKSRNLVTLSYGVNFFINISWSIIYFYLKNPRIAFFQLILLFISIIIMIYTSYKIDRKSAYLLIPYLLWVGFAGVLNYLSF